MARLDWEISIKALNKRMSTWTDKTLLHRLQTMGYTHYKPATMARINAGRYQIPIKTRLRLEGRYRRMVTQYGKQFKKTAPIQSTPILTGTWYTVEHWLQRQQKKTPSLNMEISLIKLSNRDLKFVWERGDIKIFTTRKVGGEPSKPIEGMGQFAVYEIGIYTTGVKSYVETFLQASETALYFSNPMSDKAQTEMKAQVQMYEERNQQVINSYSRTQFMYNWNKDEYEGTIKYVGIGVRL